MEEIKKKLPPEEIDNPSYKGEKPPLGANVVEPGYATAVPNHYEEIPHNPKKKQKEMDNAGYAEINDGYERPRQRHGDLPGAVGGEVNLDNPMYLQSAKGAKANEALAVRGLQTRNAKGMKGGNAPLVPPAYSEIPTPQEVQAHMVHTPGAQSPPSYENIHREPVHFKDFQDVVYENQANEVLDHHVDIKQVNVKERYKQQ